MADGMIQDLIREVLAEELAKLRPQGGAAVASGRQEELVRIGNDAELAAFVKRLLTLADNPAERSRLEAGQLAFRLAGSTTAVPASRGEASEVIEAGLLSERQVDRLPRDIKVLTLGKAVRVTPLARDRLRQRGIAIERMER